MKQLFNKFLVDNKILPYEKWNQIIIDHTNFQDKDYIRKVCQSKIKERAKGVYIYSCTNGKVLYVGQGILLGRFISHYEKLIKPEYPRHGFFNALKIVMKVSFLELPNSNTYEREVIEAMLTVVLNPIYNQRKEKKLNYIGCDINLDEWDN